MIDYIHLKSTLGIRSIRKEMTVVSYKCDLYGLSHGKQNGANGVEMVENAFSVLTKVIT